MTPFESNEINAVEVDNVKFETLVSERVLIIPETKRGSYTNVELGIRITNNTQKPFYFSPRAYAMFPEMIAPDGQIMVTGLHSERINASLDSDFVLVVSGKSVTFSRDAFLFWIQNGKKKRERSLRSLSLNIPFPEEDIYAFRPLYPGLYQFRFKYRGIREGLERDLVSQAILQNLWTGEVRTPLVEICLLES